MPSVAFAGGHGEVLSLTVVDGEVQGLDALATLRCGGLEGVVAAFSILSAVPGEGIAGSLVEVFGLAVVDSQVQCDDGVAALRRGELLRVVA